MKLHIFHSKKVIVTVIVFFYVLPVIVPIIASAATTTTTVSSTVASVISVSSGGTVNVNVTPTGTGVQTTSSDTVTVDTNNTAGYTLKIAETGASSTLTSGSDTIPATSGTQASPTALTPNKWGYRVDGVGGFGAGPTSSLSNAAVGSVTYAAVPATASPNTLKTTSSTAAGDQTTVWYSVAINTTQPPGTYTNSVTYTATANP